MVKYNKKSEKQPLVRQDYANFSNYGSSSSPVVVHIDDLEEVDLDEQRFSDYLEDHENVSNCGSSSSDVVVHIDNLEEVDLDEQASSDEGFFACSRLTTTLICKYLDANSLLHFALINKVVFKACYSSLFIPAALVERLDQYAPAFNGFLHMAFSPKVLKALDKISYQNFVRMPRITRCRVNGLLESFPPLSSGNKNLYHGRRVSLSVKINDAKEKMEEYNCLSYPVVPADEIILRDKLRKAIKRKENFEKNFTTVAENIEEFLQDYNEHNGKISEDWSSWSDLGWCKGLPIIDDKIIGALFLKGGVLSYLLSSELYAMAIYIDEKTDLTWLRPQIEALEKAQMLCSLIEKVVQKKPASPVKETMRQRVMSRLLKNTGNAHCKDLLNGAMDNTNRSSISTWFFTLPRKGSCLSDFQKESAANNAALING
jgi:hypothetical protein